MEQSIHTLPRVLIDEASIAARLDALAVEITDFYRGKPLTVVAILSGSLLFAADLLRRIPLPLQLECLNVSSYNGLESSGVVHFLDDRLPSLEGRCVLLLDDILDTGLTLDEVRLKLVSEAGLVSMHAAVLLQKRKARAREVCADWVGFEIGDKFVVGYGLDYEGEYRNLPYVGVLEASQVRSRNSGKS